MVDLDVKVTDDIAYDKLVTALMKDIKLGAAGRENLFTISYSHKDPKLAKDIVQSLLTIFVEGGLENKKQDSTSALRFLDQQIASYEEKLIASETALTAFRQKNIGLMPGQSGDYYAQLTNALEELEKAKVALKEAERARDAVRRQISGDETVLLLETHENILEKVINPEIDARIQALNLNLDNLRLNFTDLHPDIVATKRLITQLEERKKENIDVYNILGDLVEDNGGKKPTIQ
jgi:polysaccharide chain length determinant protein (PEP-CTERM system associated)